MSSTRTRTRATNGAPVSTASARGPSSFMGAATRPARLLLRPELLDRDLRRAGAEELASATGKGSPDARYTSNSAVAALRLSRCATSVLPVARSIGAHSPRPTSTHDSGGISAPTSNSGRRRIGTGTRMPRSGRTAYAAENRLPTSTTTRPRFDVMTGSSSIRISARPPAVEATMVAGEITPDAPPAGPRRSRTARRSRQASVSQRRPPSRRSRPPGNGESLRV